MFMYVQDRPRAEPRVVHRLEELTGRSTFPGQSCTFLAGWLLCISFFNLVFCFLK